MNQVLILGLCMTAAAAVMSPSTYLSADDQLQMKNIFLAQSPYKDVASAYWSLHGLSLLNALPTAAETKKLCAQLKSAYKAESAEDTFYATEAAVLLGCSLSKSGEDAMLTEAAESKKVSSIYYAYFAMKNLKMAVDNKKIEANLEAALKVDDAPMSLGYSFLLAASLGGSLGTRFNVIEDVIAQADTVEERFLQFDGGLFTTALVIEGTYKLAQAAKKAPPLSNDQVMLFSNYLLSRRHVHRLKSASQLLAALKILSNNKYHIPTAISIVNTASAISSTNNKIAVRVSNLLGGSLGKLKLTADNSRHIIDDAIILSKTQLKTTSDPSVFELDFTTIKAPFGFYRMQLTAASDKPDPKLVGLKGSVEFKVVTSIKLDSVEVSVGDKDQSTAAKASRIEYPAKISTKLEADYHQRVLMTFYVKSESTGNAVKVHQTFVRLTNKKTNQEIMFVATAEDDRIQYTFELDVGDKEKEFGSLSGDYEMSLIVGDAIVDNPINWVIADIQLSFSGQGSNPPPSQYSAKPTIEHMFRQPDKRPPAAVSNLFTGLVLAPMLIMFALWLKLGVNVSNLPMSISAIGFHAGLAGIFILYFFYWMQLNMFETLRYLAVIGLPTFLFGNRLLSGVAANRKSK